MKHITPFFQTCQQSESQLGDSGWSQQKISNVHSMLQVIPCWVFTPPPNNQRGLGEWAIPSLNGHPTRGFPSCSYRSCLYFKYPLKDASRPCFYFRNDLLSQPTQRMFSHIPEESCRIFIDVYPLQLPFLHLLSSFYSLTMCHRICLKTQKISNNNGQCS